MGTNSSAEAPIDTAVDTEDQLEVFHRLPFVLPGLVLVDGMVGFLL
ncbi:hypothetical protein [Arthrobacter sp. Leaf137]|nr:hypothetical protein [Arthrobacter sp. Leaf137]